MTTPRNPPDPEGLAVAQEIQQKVCPAEIILGGSRAAGDHRPDSDVDLMAVAPDGETAQRTRETVQELFGDTAGKLVVKDMTIIHGRLPGRGLEAGVVTVTREEFQRTAPLAQSFAGQSARHGVTPDGRNLDYRPEREPAPEEKREQAAWWLRLAEGHLDMLNLFLKRELLYDPEFLGTEAQWGLERAFKGLLAASNDGARFRRDAALLWRHVEGVRPVADREGAQAMEDLLAETAGPDGTGCRLTRFSDAYRRGTPYPDLSEGELKAVKLWIRPAIDALITEAMARSGAVREDLGRERRGGREPG